MLELRMETRRWIERDGGREGGREGGKRAPFMLLDDVRQSPLDQKV